MILNESESYFTFGAFIIFLKRVATEMYKFSNTITQTDKFKRFLQKLNISDPLQVRQSIQNMEHFKSPIDNGYGDQNEEMFFKDPKLPFLKNVKKEIVDYGSIYQEEDYGGVKKKLPKLIYKNFNKNKNITAVRRHQRYVEEKNKD